MKLPDTTITKLTALFCVAGLFALTVVPTQGQSLIFSDDLTNGAGWQFSHSLGTAQPNPGAGDTSDADFGFDYSAFGIPEAPNSNVADPATSGLRLKANVTGAFSGDAVAAVFEDASFAGQYTVKVDMWLNWAADNGTGMGTTEHGGLYVGFEVANAQNSFSPGQNGAGLTLDTDGDSSCAVSHCDYILNKGGRELDTFSGQYSVAEYLTGAPPALSGNRAGFNQDTVNTDALLGDLIDMPAMFPSFDIATATSSMNASGTQPAGAAGFQWITVTAEVDTSSTGNGDNGNLGTAKFTIENAATGETVVIGTVDNSVDDDPNDGINTGEQPVSMGGGIGLTWIDFFGGPPSMAQFGFGLFDNVRVFDGFLVDGGPDMDSDGDVDGKDFLEIQRTDPSGIPAWEADYGNGVGPLAAGGAVPEPSSLLLLLIATTLATSKRGATSAQVRKSG